MDFYSRVKREAKKLNYSLQEFVISLGINIDTYYSLKKRGSLPRTEESVKIAKALGTTVEYLVDGTHPSQGEQNLIIAYNKLNDVGKQAAVGAVKALYTVFPQYSSR